MLVVIILLWNVLQIMMTHKSLFRAASYGIVFTFVIPTFCACVYVMHLSPPMFYIVPSGRKCSLLIRLLAYEIQVAKWNEKTTFDWNLRLMESGVGWRIYVTKGVTDVI